MAVKSYSVVINNKINEFNKVINVDSDKSISIRPTRDTTSQIKFGCDKQRMYDARKVRRKSKKTKNRPSETQNL